MAAAIQTGPPTCGRTRLMAQELPDLMTAEREGVRVVYTLYGCAREQDHNGLCAGFELNPSASLATWDHKAAELVPAPEAPSADEPEQPETPAEPEPAEASEPEAELPAELEQPRQRRKRS